MDACPGLCSLLEWGSPRGHLKVSGRSGREKEKGELGASACSVFGPDFPAGLKGHPGAPVCDPKRLRGAFSSRFSALPWAWGWGRDPQWLDPRSRTTEGLALLPSQGWFLGCVSVFRLGLGKALGCRRGLCSVGLRQRDPTSVQTLPREALGWQQERGAVYGGWNCPQPAWVLGRASGRASARQCPASSSTPGTAVC